MMLFCDMGLLVKIAQMVTFKNCCGSKWSWATGHDLRNTFSFLLLNALEVLYRIPNSVCYYNIQKIPTP